MACEAPCDFGCVMFRDTRANSAESAFGRSRGVSFRLRGLDETNVRLREVSQYNRPLTWEVRSRCAQTIAHAAAVRPQQSGRKLRQHPVSLPLAALATSMGFDKQAQCGTFQL